MHPNELRELQTEKWNYEHSGTQADPEETPVRIIDKIIRPDVLTPEIQALWKKVDSHNEANRLFFSQD